MKRMKFRAVAAAGGASDVAAVAFGIVYAVLLTVHMSRELAAMQKGIVGALFAMMGILGHAIYMAAGRILQKLRAAGRDLFDKRAAAYYNTGNKAARLFPFRIDKNDSLGRGEIPHRQ